MFFNEGNVLSWATFLPVAGAVVIAVLAAFRYAAGMSKRTLDQAARAVALVASGLSLVAAIAAWAWHDPHAGRIQSLLLERLQPAGRIVFAHAPQQADLRTPYARSGRSIKCVAAHLAQMRLPD